MNSTKSSVKKRITTLQAEFGRHRETLLDRPRPPIGRPGSIVIGEPTLGRDGGDLSHSSSLRGTADASDARLRIVLGCPVDAWLEAGVAEPVDDALRGV